MTDKIFSFSNLSNILIKEGESELRKLIVSSLPTTDNNNNDCEEFKTWNKKIDRFIAAHSERYKKTCRYNLELFNTKYSNWLGQQFDITVLDTAGRNNQPVNSESASIEPISQLTQLKSFSDCSEKVKRKTCEKIRNEIDPLAIEQAYIDNLRICNKKLDANIVTKLSEASSDVKDRILQILNDKDRKCVPYTPDEALALMFDLRQSKEDYHQMHMGGKSHQANIYPAYNKILEAKKRCYPSSITITELGAEINLQALLDHTTSRILQTCQNALSGQAEWSLTLYVKWGMDGASGQSVYKQIFPENDKSTDDSSIFMTSLVPLQIKSATKIIWSNPRPSSTKYCRPISFEFVKESKCTTVEKFKKIRSQIDQLIPYTITLNKIQVKISYDLELTMIDGKTANYVTSNDSQQTCNICGATPVEMNDLDLIRKKGCKKENYLLGLSTLHCWIRFLTAVLNLAYRKPFEKWSFPNFRIALVLGLALDFVRQGSGTTNDGNTARTFFNDPKFASKTTGINEQLIRRFKVILATLCCGQNVDAEKFRKYALETAELFVTLYDWFYMPVSVHKVIFRFKTFVCYKVNSSMQVLIHGADVIATLNLPIGVYSEEAQEARNKEFRYFREHHTRKTNRLATNEDLMHALLVSSDPVVSELRREKPKNHKELDEEIVELLL
ncbi:hypothetical protein HA402_014059 [Bradysia odoriphaga]|nr:hypothetical protein HA402_014059 [Bradysia odoriphaga]